ncbi:MAG TPA: LUD domain-containing protein [Spirochaetia bacterium]|nr:LUD domain-containing protein [Spirochaetia bacterium]
MEMRVWDAVASRESIAKAAAALTANGIEASVVANGAEAREKVLSLLPADAEVFTMTSITLETIGLTKAINESGRYTSVRAAMNGMDQKTQGREMRKLGAGPDFTVGSAHAVTEDGFIVIASMTGSQLPAYAYGAGSVIWVVGAQKIVKNVDEGLKRIREYVVNHESARARRVYGLPETFSSYPSKILLFNREVQPGRAKIVIVNEALGF